MATNTTSASKGAKSVKLSQQSVNLARQIIGAEGWAKTMEDIYLGVKLLDKVLPELDSLDWVKSKEELAELTPAQVKEYLKKDKAWTDKVFDVQITQKQIDAWRRAFDTLVATGKLNPHKYFGEIIAAFGLADDSWDE